MSDWKLIASARGSCVQQYHYIYVELADFNHMHSHGVLTLAYALS